MYMWSLTVFALSVCMYVCVLEKKNIHTYTLNVFRLYIKRT